jgi:hypothetical protein
MAMKFIRAMPNLSKRSANKLGKRCPAIALDTCDLSNNLSEGRAVACIMAHDLQGLLYLMTRGLSRPYGQASQGAAQK